MEIIYILNTNKKEVQLMSIPFESLHIMTPDTTRALNNSNKNLYDTCVKREYNFEELSQNLQYSGTVENFGSEVLLEARKLNEKYILPESFFSKDVIVTNIKAYFEPMWSPLTPTTEQCPIVQCVLKDIFLEDHTYELYIEDAELVCFPRSDSTSDPSVHKSFFYVPKYKGESIYDNIMFKDTNDSTHYAEAFILYNRGAETNRMMGFLVNDYTRDRIDVTPDGGKTKATITLTERDVDLPWLWYYSKYESEDYTHIELSGDTTDINGHDLINFGTDGHGNMFGYVLLYGENNLPTGSYEDHEWFIRCYPTSTEPFDDGEDNYKKKIQTIILGYGTDVFHLDHMYTINVDNCDDVKLLLDNGTRWNFHTPEEGEDVYDTDKRTYAYLMLSMFEDNIPDDATLKPTFRFSSKIEYENPYSTRYIANINAKNGVHLDTSDDGCDHSVPTKNGSIHSLGDFDGIPDYFHTHLDESIHRIHAELYTINEDVAISQTVMQRPTAALLFDSGLPHNESDLDTSDLEMNIKYDFTPGRQFSSIGPPADPSNALSEIVYIDPYNFGTSAEAKYATNPKFVYHGNRVFSLTKSGLDPEYEIGRVYYLSNDPAHYINNGIDNDRAPTTMARICDIPTSFLQLIQIPNLAPSVLNNIPDYVRSECSFSEDDKERIWNEIHPMFVSDGNTYVPSYVADVSLMPAVMELTFNTAFIDDKYAHYSQLFGKLDLDNTPIDYLVTPSVGGSGYAPGDIIGIMIGGVKVEYEVITAPSGEVTSVLIRNRDSYPPLDKSLFKTRITTYETDNISSSGTGCTLSLEIHQAKWNSFIQTKGNAFGIDIYGLCRDPYENLWVLCYDTATDEWEVMSQLTGVPYVQNIYDEIEIDTHGIRISRRDRSVTNVFMYNLMNERNNTSSMGILNDTHTNTDERFEDDTLNIQDMTYMPHDTDVVEYAGRDIVDGSNVTLLPRFHQLNLDKMYNHTNLHICSDNEKHQVLPFIYNPFKTYKDQYIDGRYSKNGDIMLSEYYSDFIVDDALTHDVYEYNLYEKNSYFETYRESLELLPRENLIALLTDQFPDSVLLNDIDEYSTEYIIDYMMTNSYPRPLYLRNDRKVLRHRGDVVERNGKPVGEQQTGWFEYLTDYHNPHVTVDTSPFRSNEFNIFKIEDTTVTSLDPLRIYDEFGNDISQSSLILFGDNMYYFNTNRWVNIHDIS